MEYLEPGNPTYDLIKSIAPNAVVHTGRYSGSMLNPGGTEAAGYAPTYKPGSFFTLSNVSPEGAAALQKAGITNFYVMDSAPNNEGVYNKTQYYDAGNGPTSSYVEMRKGNGGGFLGKIMGGLTSLPETVGRAAYPAIRSGLDVAHDNPLATAALALGAAYAIPTYLGAGAAGAAGAGGFGGAGGAFLEGLPALGGGAYTGGAGGITGFGGASGAFLEGLPALGGGLMAGSGLSAIQYLQLAKAGINIAGSMGGGGARVPSSGAFTGQASGASGSGLLGGNYATTPAYLKKPRFNLAQNTPPMKSWEDWNNFNRDMFAPKDYA